MRQSKKKIRGKGARGNPPKDGENRFVISHEDTRAYQGKIVAVAGFPPSGGYANVVARGDDLDELKRDLRILDMLDESKDDRGTVTVHVYPGLDVWCYVNVSRSRPQIVRKGRRI